MPNRFAPLGRWTTALACLAILFAGSPVREASAATKKKSSKTWPKKHKKAATPAKTPAATDDSGGESADKSDSSDQGGDDTDETPAPKKTTTKTVSKSKVKAESDDDSGDEDDSKKSASSDESDESDADDHAPVVRKKSKKPVVEEGEGAALPGLELDLGSRALHRTFDFNDPLSDHDPNVSAPGSYSLPAGPVPFVHVGIYPLAFAGGGPLSNIGLIGSYEQLIGTKTIANKGAANETSSTSSGHEYEIGLRGRLPLDGAELGLAAAYGQHEFRVTSTDVPPGPGAIVPNVDYTFFRLGLDGRVRVSVVTLGAHLGTRLVPKTGPLAKEWFNTTKTTSVEAGVSVAYPFTSMVAIVGGVDFLRYAFDFNPLNPNDPVKAGGAVDQYISGFLALRLSLSGS